MTQPFPDKKYQVIYADPPWTYRDKALAGQRGAGCKYSLLTQDEIADLPIPEIAATDCALFLWITMPKLDEVFPIIAKWGFSYKTVAFTWVKQNKSGVGFFWGMGRWTRANAELCLLATRGSPKRLSAAVHSVISTPIEGHSKKPDCTRERIVTLCGDVPRIELFARQQTDGWDVWGNQVNGDGNEHK